MKTLLISLLLTCLLSRSALSAPTTLFSFDTPSDLQQGAAPQAFPEAETPARASGIRAERGKEDTSFLTRAFSNQGGETLPQGPRNLQLKIFLNGAAPYAVKLRPEAPAADAPLAVGTARQLLADPAVIDTLGGGRGWRSSIPWTGGWCSPSINHGKATPPLTSRF